MTRNFKAGQHSIKEETAAADQSHVTDREGKGPMHVPCPPEGKGGAWDDQNRHGDVQWRKNYKSSSWAEIHCCISQRLMESWVDFLPYSPHREKELAMMMRRRILYQY